MRRAFALVLALAAAPAHAETRPRYGGKIVASLGSAPTTVDPVAAQSYADVLLSSLLYDTLYRVDEQGLPQPHLAEAVPWFSADKKEARFRVRKGVKFHDGRAVGAKDVVASLKRAQTASGTAWLLAPVSKVARDGQEVVLTLSREVTDLTTLLAAPQLAVTPGGKAPGAKSVVGSGPFQVKKLALDGKKIELEASLTHFAGRPYLDALTVRWFDDPDEEARAYEAGEADVSLHGSVAFAGRQPKYPTATVDSPATILVYVGFGKAHADVTGDVELRRAVSLALNRSAFRLVGSGERVVPSTLPESPDLGGRSPTSEESAARIDAAKQSLEAAAKRVPALKRGRPSLELILDKTRPDDVEVATRVVGALDALGIELSYTALEPRELQRRIAAGQCDLYLGQLVAPTGELVHEYAAAFAAAGDKWPVARMAAGDLTVDAAAQAFAERQPIVPLYHHAVRASHTKTLVGLAFDALARLGYADASLHHDEPPPVPVEP